MTSFDYPQNVFRANLRREIYGSPRFMSHYHQNQLPQRVPEVLRERLLNVEDSDKIFASAWLSDSAVIIGTKCNRLCLIDTSSGRSFDIPLIQGMTSLPSGLTNCGIHSIAINPSRTLMATGGENPCAVAIYALPSLVPLAILEAHSDWIFSCTWVDDDHLVSGSRDQTLSLWSLDFLRTKELPEGAEVLRHPCGPIFSLRQPQSRTKGEQGKVRDTLSLGQSKRCASLTSCGAIHLWDASTLTQLSALHSQEADSVCLNWQQLPSSSSSSSSFGCHGNGTTGVLVAGSLHKLSFFDVRAPKMVFADEAPDEAGVRSVSFSGHVVTVGGGFGKLAFYDSRNRAYLVLDQPSQGFFYHTEQSVYGMSYNPTETKGKHAIYTHCYDDSQTRLFTAGGPLHMAYKGSYAALWE